MQKMQFAHSQLDPDGRTQNSKVETSRLGIVVSRLDSPSRAIYMSEIRTPKVSPTCNSAHSHTAEPSQAESMLAHAGSKLEMRALDAASHSNRIYSSKI